MAEEFKINARFVSDADMYNAQRFPIETTQLDSESFERFRTEGQKKAVTDIFKYIGGEISNPSKPNENTMYNLLTRALKMNVNRIIPFTVDRTLLFDLNKTAADGWPSYPSDCTFTSNGRSYELKFNSHLMDLTMAWISALQCRTVDLPALAEDILTIAKVNYVRENVKYIRVQRVASSRPIRLLTQVWNLWHIYVFAKQSQPTFHRSVGEAFMYCWAELIDTTEISFIANKVLNKGVNPTKGMTPEEIQSLDKFFKGMIQLLQSRQWVPSKFTEEKVKEIQRELILKTTSLKESLLSMA